MNRGSLVAPNSDSDGLAVLSGTVCCSHYSQLRRGKMRWVPVFKKDVVRVITVSECAVVTRKKWCDSKCACQMKSSTGLRLWATKCFGESQQQSWHLRCIDTASVKMCCTGRRTNKCGCKVSSASLVRRRFSGVSFSRAHLFGCC